MRFKSIHKSFVKSHINGRDDFVKASLRDLKSRANERRAPNLFDCYPECRRDKTKSSLVQTRGEHQTCLIAIPSAAETRRSQSVINLCINHRINLPDTHLRNLSNLQGSFFQTQITLILDNRQRKPKSPSRNAIFS